MKNGSASYMGEFDGYARPKYSAEIAQATAQENLRRRGTKKATISQTVVVAETVIVGIVPESFLNVGT